MQSHFAHLTPSKHRRRSKNESFNTEMGEIIKNHRINQDLKAEEIATKLHVGTYTVQRWERGDHPPSAEDLTYLILVLGDEFLTDIKKLGTERLGV